MIESIHFWAFASCPAARRAFHDWKELPKEAAKEPTHVEELVAGPADYKGTLDASGRGAGGVWVSGQRDMAPIVWRVEWPQEVWDCLVTFKNLSRDITNSDLEMAAEILG